MCAFESERATRRPRVRVLFSSVKTNVRRLGGETRRSSGTQRVPLPPRGGKKKKKKSHVVTIEVVWLSDVRVDLIEGRERSSGCRRRSRSFVVQKAVLSFPPAAAPSAVVHASAAITNGGSTAASACVKFGLASPDGTPVAGLQQGLRGGTSSAPSTYTVGLCDVCT